jgi:alpha-L-fucosidase
MANPVNAQGFNEGRLKYSAKDIRFNKKGDKVLYVTLLGVPEEDITVKALGSKTAQNTRKIKSVTMLGSDEKVEWTQDKDILAIGKPVAVPAEEAVVYKVVFR